MSESQRRGWCKPLAGIACAAVLVLAGTATPARADVIYFFNNPSGFSAQLNALGLGDDNVLYNDPGLILTGNPVQGTTQGGFIMHFSTVGDTLTAAGGQARIEALDGSYDDLLIDALNPFVYFRSLSFNISPLTAGTITFTVADQFGLNPPEIQVVPVAGLFFFGAVSINGQFIDNVRFSSTGQVTDIRQVRVGGDQLITIVPEPAALLLFGTGLVGLGLQQRRRKR